MTDRAGPTDVPVRARTGGMALVESLLAHDVPLWTCVPGESFLPILDALYDIQQRGEGAARLVTTRHEAAAANMAEAAGKLTGRAAVCLVTRGPGATHASIALHTAHQDGTPLILVVGQVARAHLGRNAFQEMDFRMVFGDSAKSVVTIMDADRIPEHVARAVYDAHAGRPGPVVLVVPEDVLAEETDTPVSAAVRPSRPVLSTPDRELLVRALEQSRRPVVVVGGPGWSHDVGDGIVAFADANDVPLAAAFRWHDAVDNSNRCYAGYLGLGCSARLRERVGEADLVVAFGPRLDDPTTNGYTIMDGRQRLVLVSSDAEELGRYWAPHEGIHCDLRAAARALRDTKLPTSASRQEWLDALRTEQVRFSTPAPSDLDVDLAAIVRHVREQLPDDAIVTNGAGNYTVWLQRFFEFRQFGTQLAPRNGAMGYGLPAGLAAAALHPDRPVVTFAGDGCFLMSGSELATAVQNKLRLVVVVVNNSMFGTIRMHQERAYPGRRIATALHNPDFAAYARSFGAFGSTVTATAEFAEAFELARRHDGPAVIDVRTDPRQLTPDLRLDD